MKNAIILTFAFLITATTLTAGGPWTQEKGIGYFKFSQWWINFDSHYTDSGKIDPNVTTGIYNTFVYGEYGITDRLTGIVNAAVFSRNVTNNLVSGTTSEIITPGEALNGFGDTDLGIKYRLTKKESRIAVAASLYLGIPTGQTGQGAQGNLQTGDGEFNQYLRLDAGTSFKLAEKINSYVSVYGGVNNRTRGFSEELRYGAEVGAGLLDGRLWLIGRLDGTESFKNGETAAGNVGTSIFANNTEYTSFGGEAALYVKRGFGVSVSFASAFRGEVIAAAPSYSAGVFWDLGR